MKTGIDCVDEYLPYLEGKRVGLITNHTGISNSFNPTEDFLFQRVNLVALFAPEHGIKGELQAGVKYDAAMDEKLGIPVFSLYGNDRRPDKEMLDLIDVLSIDIQDVGSRFYTYIYTMAYAMQACAEYDKEFIVFDRPNPIGGIHVEGNILDLQYRSFIGYYPIVQRHGMTIGELALLFNEEYNIGCKLRVIKMRGWERRMYFQDTGLIWIAPSPNCPTPETAFVYPGTCIFEGTNVSEGRGTTLPFQVIGAPYINPDRFSVALNSFNFPGVFFRAVYFRPTFSKYANVLCGGVQIHILDSDLFTPVAIGWVMLNVIRQMYPDDFVISPPWREGKPCMLEYNTGCDYISRGLYNIDELKNILERDTKTFLNIRERYLIYQ